MIRILTTFQLLAFLAGSTLAIRGDCAEPAKPAKPQNRHWSQFRGPAGDGRADGAKIPLQWSEEDNVLWKLEVRGKGWSSPVIWGDRLWLTTATLDGKKMFAICVNRHNGKVLHEKLVFENEKPRFCHPTNSYASPTPTVEEGRVYVHFGSYGTACLDSHTADVLWSRRDLPCNHWRGPGSSPIVDAKNLYVAFDGYDLQYVVALDKRTGATVWRQDRNIDYGTDNGDRKKAYSTATLIESGGQRQLISPSAAATIAYDPQSGKELWRIQHGGMNAAIRPLFGHGLLYVMAGSGPNSLLAIRPEGRQTLTDQHIAWNSGSAVPKRPSPLLIGKRLFMIDDGGVASCRDAMTGTIIWKKRIGGQFRASPIYANGRIYTFSLEGETAVIAAADEFKLLASNRLDNGFQASPAVADDALYVRTISHLYGIGK